MEGKVCVLRAFYSCLYKSQTDVGFFVNYTGMETVSFRECTYRCLIQQVFIAHNFVLEVSPFYPLICLN